MKKGAANTQSVRRSKAKSAGGKVDSGTAYTHRKERRKERREERKKITAQRRKNKNKNKKSRK